MIEGESCPEKLVHGVIPVTLPEQGENIGGATPRLSMAKSWPSEMSSPDFTAGVRFPHLEVRGNTSLLGRMSAFNGLGRDMVALGSGIPFGFFPFFIIDSPVHTPTTLAAFVRYREM